MFVLDAKTDRLSLRLAVLMAATRCIVLGGAIAADA